MPLYMTQFAYTPEAWAALVRKPEDRVETTRALLEQAGGRLLQYYYSWGDYDGVMIFEAPDESVATAVLLAGISAGHLKAVKTTTLLPAEKALAAMRAAGTLALKPPGA